MSIDRLPIRGEKRCTKWNRDGNYIRWDITPFCNANRHMSNWIRRNAFDFVKHHSSTTSAHSVRQIALALTLLLFIFDMEHWISTEAFYIDLIHWISESCAGCRHGVFYLDNPNVNFVNEQTHYQNQNRKITKHKTHKTQNRSEWTFKCFSIERSMNEDFHWWVGEKYTFSHCEPAPSQLNAAWGNSFRQLHSNFDNLLALRQISLE